MPDIKTEYRSERVIIGAYLRDGTSKSCGCPCAHERLSTQRDHVPSSEKSRTVKTLPLKLAPGAHETAAGRIPA